MAGLNDRIVYVLRKLYKRGSLDYFRLVMNMESMENISLVNAYLSHLARKELELIKQYKDIATRIEETKKQLDKELEKVSNRREKAGQELIKARNEQAELERMLGEIRRQSGIYSKSLEEKKRARVELQRLIKRLAGKKSTVTTPTSFAALRGRLSWPVKGSVLTGFGTVRDDVYNVSLQSDGIEIRADAGTPVRVVAEGKVLFSDWNDMGGNMVVIDHGRRFYTIYAHLSRMTVQTGDNVVMGDIIGFVGDSASLKGAMLRFEIRHVSENSEPRALDPLDWLTRQR